MQKYFSHICTQIPTAFYTYFYRSYAMLFEYFKLRVSIKIKKREKKHISWNRCFHFDRLTCSSRANIAFDVLPDNIRAIPRRYAHENNFDRCPLTSFQLLRTRPSTSRTLSRRLGLKKDSIRQRRENQVERPGMIGKRSPIDGRARRKGRR